MTENPAEARVAARCKAMVDGMKLLRFADLELPEFGVGGGDVHQSLVDIRARLDQAEDLKLHARTFRRKTRALALLRKQKADDDYDKRLEKLSSEAAVRREYEGAQERMAQARTAVLDQRREARSAERMQVLAEDAYDSIQDMFFGLLNIREELIQRMRELQWETNLEGGV